MDTAQNPRTAGHFPSDVPRPPSTRKRYQVNLSLTPKEYEYFLARCRTMEVPTRLEPHTETVGQCILRMAHAAVKRGKA